MKEIEVAVRAGTPVLIWGPPGVGKTATILAVGRRLGIPVEVVVASIREPSDFCGLPVIHDGQVAFAPPAWARRLASAGRGMLFLDEITCCPPAVQAGLLRVVLDRVVGDLPLPEGVAIIAAANPPEQTAGGWELAPPLANRFVHLEWKPDPLLWAAEFPTYWGSPPHVVGLNPAAWARARALAAAFIRHRPHLLLQVPDRESAAGRAWPSPRSWDAASRVLAAAEVAGADPTALVVGSVGEGAALEFLGWRRSLDLPEPERLLGEPALIRQVAGAGDRAFAAPAAVAAHLGDRISRQAWNAAWRLAAEAAACGLTDAAAASLVRHLARNRGTNNLPAEAMRPYIALLRGAGTLS